MFLATTILQERAEAEGVKLDSPISDAIIDQLRFPVIVSCVDCGEPMRLPRALVTEDGLILCEPCAQIETSTFSGFLGTRRFYVRRESGGYVVIDRTDGARQSGILRRKSALRKADELNAWTSDRSKEVA